LHWILPLLNLIFLSGIAGCESRLAPHYNPSLLYCHTFVMGFIAACRIGVDDGWQLKTLSVFGYKRPKSPAGARFIVDSANKISFHSTLTVQSFRCAEP